MAEDTYTPGQVARLTLAVADLAGAASDPGAVQLKIKAPDATLVVYTYGVDSELVRDSLGKFHADIPLPAAGQWAYRWELTTPNAGAAEGTLHVRNSYVA